MYFVLVADCLLFYVLVGLEFSLKSYFTLNFVVERTAIPSYLVILRNFCYLQITSYCLGYNIGIFEQSFCCEARSQKSPWKNLLLLKWKKSMLMGGVYSLWVWITLEYVNQEQSLIAFHCYYTLSFSTPKHVRFNLIILVVRLI